MDGDRKRFFENHAACWDAQHGPAPELLERVIRLADIGPGQVILDVGSGTGVLIPFILQAGPPTRLVALDTAAAMIEQLRKKQFPPVVEIVQGDIQQAPFADATFDRILANAVFPHLDRPDLALRQMRRILRPDGILAISHPRGRRWVNAHHRTHAAIAQDILPPGAVLARRLASLGFNIRCVEDTADFYCIIAGISPSQETPDTSALPPSSW